MNLSKSKYTQGVQCPKMLWMQRHMPEQFDESVLNESVLRNGNAVGDLAMGYYGEFEEIPFDRGDYAGMAARTQELLEAGVPNICEATFIHDGDLCMVDILRNFGDYVELVEVKSSTKRKDVYLHDIAYQTWLLRQCGLDVRKASLMHVDTRYVRGERFDLHEFFHVEDLTDTVEEMLSAIPQRIGDMKAVGTQPDEPEQAIGPHCFLPYECGFRQWCWGNVPHPSVFDLCRVSKAKAFGLYEEGIVTFDDLVESGKAGKLTKMQKLQVAAELEGTEHVDKPAIKGFLDGLWFPLHFLDFETFNPAVPEFPGTRPYQQIPSQYSLHIIEGPCPAVGADAVDDASAANAANDASAKVQHKEFLAKEGTDPRRAIAESLVRDIPADACVLAWNMDFEKGCLRGLADTFPDLAPQLLAIRDNVRDLIDPFRKGHYYTREMQGSSSIKKVLPALFPNDPELDYHALDGVHNGAEAIDAFQGLIGRPPEEIAQIRQQLLRYCELDTFAMVKIWQKLVEVAG